MNDTKQKELGKTLWNIADRLRGAMNADDFRDYMLSFLFLRYLSDNYEVAVKKELGKDYVECEKKLNKILKNNEHDSLINELENQIDNFYKKQNLSSNELARKIKEEKEMLNSNKITPFILWYIENLDCISDFEKQMKRKIHFIIRPHYLWSNISELARTQNPYLLITLQKGFKFIENESFDSKFKGLFSEVNLDSEKLGKNYTSRNEKLCSIIKEIANGLSEFPNDTDILGDAYEYLISEFAAGSGKKAGEFYTPQQISTILSRIVTLDCQNPSLGSKTEINNILDFACGSGS